MSVAGGESDTLAVLDEDACAECITDNRDVIVGVKVRLTAAVCGQGSTEIEAYRYNMSVCLKNVSLKGCFKSQTTWNGLTLCDKNLYFAKIQIKVDIYKHAVQPRYGKSLHYSKGCEGLHSIFILTLVYVYQFKFN